MAILSTLINVLSTESVPPFVIAEYSSDGIGADTTSTDLILIELPARSKLPATYRNVPNNTTTGEAYAVKLVGFSISCLSTNYDISILNKDDITLLNSINEVMKYTGLDRAESDQSFDEFIIRNRDDSLVNNLYLYIDNHDVIPTGTISLELIYVTIQDRVF